MCRKACSSYSVGGYCFFASRFYRRGVNAMEHRGRVFPIGLVVTTLTLIVIAFGFAVFAFWLHDGETAELETPGSEAAGSTVAGLASAPVTSMLVSGRATSGVALSTITATAGATYPTVSTQTVASISTEQMLAGQVPVAPLPFDGEQAMTHVKVLAEDIGPREAGSEQEEAAKDYVVDYLTSLGYQAYVTAFALPDGRVSHNIRAAQPGASLSTIILGAHIDTVATSPGANDNGSGVGVVLELARDLHAADVSPRVEFVFFGAEEVVGDDPNQHHLGSRHYVDMLTPEETAELAGMISVDMIAYGNEFLVRTMDRGPLDLANMLLKLAADTGVSAIYAPDPGETGWSDHEAFENAGYPVAWLERRPDATHHTADDTYVHCEPALVQQTGELLLSFITTLKAGDLQLLQAAAAVR